MVIIVLKCNGLISEVLVQRNMHSSNVRVNTTMAGGIKIIIVYAVGLVDKYTIVVLQCIIIYIDFSITLNG